MRLTHLASVGAAGLCLLAAAPALAQSTDPMPAGAPAQTDPAQTDTSYPQRDTSYSSDPSSTGREYPYNGLYIGGAVSYDVQGNDVGERVLFDRGGSGTVTTAAGTDAFSPGFCNGAAYGPNATGCANDRDDIGYYGRVGFDVQRSALVFGAVAEFGKSEITDSVTAFSTTPASYTLTRSIDWELGLRGRLGLAANKTLFYGTGGAGYARIKNRFTTTNTANAFATNGNQNKWGWQAGGGIEQMIGRHFSFGLEYLYHNYDANNARVLATQGTAPATNPFVLNGASGTTFRRSDNKFDWHSMRFTVGFRF